MLWHGGDRDERGIKVLVHRAKRCGAVSAAMSVLCVFAKFAIDGAGMCRLLHQTRGFIIGFYCWTCIFNCCASFHSLLPPHPHPHPWVHQFLPSNTRQDGISVRVVAEDVNCCENERKQSPSSDASQCLLHNRPAVRWGLLAKSDWALIGWQTETPAGQGYIYILWGGLGISRCNRNTNTLLLEAKMLKLEFWFNNVKYEVFVKVSFNKSGRKWLVMMMLPHKSLYVNQWWV